MTSACNRIAGMCCRWSVVVAATVSLVAPAYAATLDTLQSTWPELNLRSSLASGSSPEIEQGSNFQLRIAADAEASIAVVLVNAEGNAQVSIPKRDGTGDRISRGTEMLFPDALSGETLYADMPVGKGYAYVIGSPEPIFGQESRELSAWVSADQMRGSIDSTLRAKPELRIAVKRLPLHVVAAAMKDFVSTEEFVQFYGIGTRSVANADRGFRIEFAYDSADLTDWSRRQLDAVSAGMKDQRLATFAFEIEGHTDDVGSEDYNLGLSERRARAVNEYLNSHGVGRGRTSTRALGETRPQVEGTTENARAANRRVVIRRVDAPR
jgi:outer membrane protein OmpA-like peptidoglycan-associated protein